jgi:hypothetical protein
VVEGNNATLRVIATGEITGYQWRKDGVDLGDIGHYSGVTTATLTITGADSGDAGTYVCFITGACGNMLSNSATLTVISSTIITAHPTPNVTKCEGETLELTVTPATGYTYQWKRGNSNLVNDARISGANTSALTITGVSTADQGAYTCVVGTEISQPSIVTVNPTISLTSNPSDATKCVGDSHIFSVTATGSGLTYKWFKDNVEIPLAISSEYIISPLAVGDAGLYYCEVSGACGSLTIIRISSSARLEVKAPAVITAPLVETTPTVCQGESTTLTITATGDNLTYLWKKNGGPITGTNITGVTSNQLVISNALTTDGGVYTCTVTGYCGSPRTSARMMLLFYQLLQLEIILHTNGTTEQI